MEPNLNHRLFVAFNHAGRYLRAGRPSGAIPHNSKDRDCRKHRFRRETILPILLDHEGGMRPNQIAEEIHAGASTLSEMINRLENDGYILRSSDPSDRRATILTLTKAGEIRARELKAEANNIFAQLFSKLSSIRTDLICRTMSPIR